MRGPVSPHLFCLSDCVTDPQDRHDHSAEATQTLVPQPDAQIQHGTATCNLWWTRTPFEEDHVTGYIGNLSAPSGDGSTLTVLLEKACDRLQAEGATLAVGPINGSTWGDYRLVTDLAPGEQSEAAPAFPGEPPHAPDLRAALDAAGFTPWQTYRSGLVPDLGAMPEPQPQPSDTYALRTARTENMEQSCTTCFP